MGGGPGAPAQFDQFDQGPGFGGQFDSPRLTKGPPTPVEFDLLQPSYMNISLITFFSV